MIWRRKVRKYEDPNNETEIVVVHKDESSPASVMRLVIAGLFIVLAAITIGQQLYFQGQRESDRKAQSARDAHFQKDQVALNDRLQQQIDETDADQERLRNLVIGLLTAKSPEESRRLLEKFILESKRQDAARATPAPTPQTTPTRQNGQNGGSPGSPSPRPSASHPGGSGPSRSPSPSPSCVLPKPVPPVPVLCQGVSA